MTPEPNTQTREEKKEVITKRELIQLIKQKDADVYDTVLACLVENIDIYLDDNDDIVVGAYDGDVVECLLNAYGIESYTNDDIDEISYTITDSYRKISRIARQAGDILYYRNY